MYAGCLFYATLHWLHGIFSQSVLGVTPHTQKGDEFTLSAVFQLFYCFFKASDFHKSD